jgi:hypothetical protein
MGGTKVMYSYLRALSPLQWIFSHFKSTISPLRYSSIIEGILWIELFLLKVRLIMENWFSVILSLLQNLHYSFYFYFPRKYYWIILHKIGLVLKKIYFSMISVLSKIDVNNSLGSYY